MMTATQPDLHPFVAAHLRRMAQAGTGYRRNNTPIKVVPGDAAPALKGDRYFKPHSWRYGPSTARVEVGRAWLSRRVQRILREETEARKRSKREAARQTRLEAHQKAVAEKAIAALSTTGDVSAFRADLRLRDLAGEVELWKWLRMAALIAEALPNVQVGGDLAVLRDQASLLLSSLSEDSTPRDAAQAWFALHEYRRAVLVQHAEIGFYAGWSRWGDLTPCAASIAAALA
jgi:hypothetical protein